MPAGEKVSELRMNRARTGSNDHVVIGSKGCISSKEGVISPYQGQHRLLHVIICTLEFEASIVQLQSSEDALSGGGGIELSKREAILVSSKDSDGILV